MKVTNELLFAIIAILAILIVACIINNFANAQSQNNNLNNQFLGLFNNITAETLLNYTLITNKDQSISLNAFLPNATKGPDGKPDAMRLIASYSNSNALIGPNGVEDVLTKLAKSWNVVDIKQELRNK